MNHSNLLAPVRGWLWVFAGLLLALYTTSPQYVGVNQNARFDLTKAIVLDHSFSITSYVSNTGDWSKKDGVYYSNKSPGGSFLMVPVFWVLSKAEQTFGFDPRNNATIDRKNIQILNIFVTIIPTLILTYFLLLYLLSLGGFSLKRSWMLVFAYCVGTLAFAYSTMWFGHQTAAAFIFLSFYAMVRGQKPIIAGLLFGLTVLTEYSLLAAAPAFFAWYIFTQKKHSRWISLTKFCLGGLPFAIVLGLYHYFCFGSPFSSPFKFSNPELIDHSMWFGLFHWPLPEALYSVLFSRQRGIMAFSPILLFSFLGFYRWLSQPRYRAEGLVALWTIATIYLFSVTYFGWRGGSCAGARYLVPIIPFLVSSLAFVKQGRIFSIGLLFSVFHNISIVAVDLMPDMEANVLKDKIYLELFRQFNSHLSFLWMSGIVILLLLIAYQIPRAYKIDRSSKRLAA